MQERKNNPGVSEGVGTDARFERPQLVTPYLDGSILVYDEGSYQIKKIDSKGVVTNFLGQAYNGSGNQEGSSADGMRI